MEWLKTHIALVFSVASLASGLVTYFTDNFTDKYITSIGFAVIALLFFLLWVGQRGGD